MTQSAFHVPTDIGSGYLKDNILGINNGKYSAMRTDVCSTIFLAPFSSKMCLCNLRRYLLSPLAREIAIAGPYDAASRSYVWRVSKDRALQLQPCYIGAWRLARNTAMGRLYSMTSELRLISEKSATRFLRLAHAVIGRPDILKYASRFFAISRNIFGSIESYAYWVSYGAAN